MINSSRAPGGIALLVGSLFTWAVILAMGAFVFGYRSDMRKPLIVVGVMLAFLASWLMLMYQRQRRIISERPPSAADDIDNIDASTRATIHDDVSSSDSQDT